MKKWIACILGVFMLAGTFGAFAGCRGNNQEGIDDTKTQLYVSNYDGGIGTDWLYELEERFENEYADYKGENGKVGVQIFIDPNKTNGRNLVVSASDSEVFFGEFLRYFDLVAAGDVLDITDVVQEVLGQEGVGMSDFKKESLTAFDGKYYALPHYEVYSGVIYNKDIWEDYGLYISADGNFVKKSSGVALGVGPDGITPSDDDGLPASWEEFFNLCNYMVNDTEVTPLAISGQNVRDYALYFLNSAFASYNGAEGVAANFTFDGNVEYVTDVTENSTSALGYDFTVASEDIDNSTGYRLSQQSGKFVALAALAKLLENKDDYFYTPSLNNTVSQLDAEEYFIRSVADGAPIAMLIDGSWWENEATDAFERLESENPKYSKETSNYGFMPLPTVVEGTPEQNTVAVYDYIQSYAFISGYIDESKIDIAKEFLKYCYRPENLRKFTEITGVARGMEYEMDQPQLDSMTSYAQSVWEMHKSGEVVSVLSGNDIFMDNSASIESTLWSSRSYASPWSAFYSGAMNAKDYFAEMSTSKSAWDSTYGGKYF